GPPRLPPRRIRRFRPVLPGDHHRQRGRARGRDLPCRRARGRDDAAPAQRRLSRRVRRRDPHPLRRHRLLAAAVPVQRLERLRPDRRRRSVRARPARERDAAADPAAAAHRPRDPAAARPAGPRGRGRAVAARRRLARPADRPAAVRLRDGRLADLRRREPRGLRDDRQRDAHAVRDAHAREPARQPRDGPAALGVDDPVLPELRAAGGVRALQPLHRDRHQLDGGG
ncbi:MAG: hypothetical protein AVDCRST_MAG65-1357, partial [uncultured Solirubrobacteraceae bacterium]